MNSANDPPVATTIGWHTASRRRSDYSELSGALAPAANVLAPIPQANADNTDPNPGGTGQIPGDAGAGGVQPNQTGGGELYPMK